MTKFKSISLVALALAAILIPAALGQKTISGGGTSGGGGGGVTTAQLNGLGQRVTNYVNGLHDSPTFTNLVNLVSSDGNGIRFGTGPNSSLSDYRTANTVWVYDSTNFTYTINPAVNFTLGYYNAGDSVTIGTVTAGGFATASASASGRISLSDTNTNTVTIAAQSQITSNGITIFLPRSGPAAIPIGGVGLFVISNYFGTSLVMKAAALSGLTWDGSTLTASGGGSPYTNNFPNGSPSNVAIGANPTNGFVFTNNVTYIVNNGTNTAFYSNGVLYVLGSINVGGTTVTPTQVQSAGNFTAAGSGLFNWQSRTAVSSGSNGLAAFLTSGFGANAQILYAERVVNSATNRTIGMAESGSFFNNFGASGAITNVLTNCYPGFHATFTLTTNLPLYVQATNNMTIHYGTLTTSANGLISCTNQYSSLHLFGISTNEFYIDVVATTNGIPVWGFQ